MGYDLENVDEMVKSLKEDKENLEITNKGLKERSNVYRFQSTTHRKIAQSLKQERNGLKSRIVELLEEYAPSKVQEILKDTKCHKINVPLNANKLSILGMGDMNSMLPLLLMK